MKARILVVLAALALSGFALTSCSTQARAERKGKEAGDQICAAKNADNADDAQRHINRANDKLNDLARFTGRDVREDVRDLDRNLNQMHAGTRRTRTSTRSCAACRAPDHRPAGTRSPRTTECWRRSPTAPEQCCTRSGTPGVKSEAAELRFWSRHEHGRTER